MKWNLSISNCVHKAFSSLVFFSRIKKVNALSYRICDYYDNTHFNGDGDDDEVSMMIGTNG